ncbi:TraB/GumN family protein [Methanocella arvoryzae]|uniref:Pheromone shutdown protein (TraB family) n=1 Tax=Methanocella arvoryzae (strain DSM 22066 / NBRC 105507 / MRE50) TaxID=351160 RepID=Q0W6W2_METAR|nr:putative pheromone shutdown protein (TraB family) [Methanocella arvoryzae MRE50]
MRTLTDDNKQQPAGNLSTDAKASLSFTVPLGQPVSPNPRDNIFLVGTAHVSEKSIREVEEAIEHYAPDVVAVELDDRRFKALQQPEDEKKNIEIKELLKGNNLMIFLLQYMLAYVQRKVGSDVGVKPGAEMMAAVAAAQKKGIPVARIDRDIGVTLARFWAKMTLREKFRMFYSLVLAMLGYGTDKIDLEEITKEDVVSDLLEELRDFTPTAAVVLVDERDAYLAHNLIEIGKTKRVLGVVGAGHREGIRKYIEHPEKVPPIHTLVEIPKKRKFPLVKIISALIVLSVVAVLGLLLLSGKSLIEVGQAMIVLFIVQGVLSALFVAIVGGHWKSIATAFGLAWCGFLNPLLAIGWLAGVVEATQRPPTMNDLNTILGNEEDSFVKTFQNMFRNRLFKAILVAAMANIGSTLGTFVGIFVLAYFFGLNDPVGLLQSGLSNGYNTVMMWIGSVLPK